MFIRLSHKASHTHITNSFSLSIYVDHIQRAWLAIQFVRLWVGLFDVSKPTVFHSLIKV